MALNRNSSPKSEWKYHVFLSFRGEDTRLGFTDLLYAALLRKGIKTFRDDEELPKGEVIKKELLATIEESLSAIIIISENYAASAWCLDELQKIVETRQSLGRQVFPVFYGVDPSDVRHQRGSFAEAMRKHEEKFVEDKGRVQRWREALKDVGNLAGWNSKNMHESELIEDIAAEVWTTIKTKLRTDNDRLVAIESKVNEMCSLLRPDLEDVRFIEIWGMGGIGKTTLATLVFEKIQSQFHVSCFLSSVREASKEGEEGLIQLQNKLLSHLKLKSMIIETSAQGKTTIENLLQEQKVLLVLDDVSDISQLENLAGNKKWFGRGSRIIVTTRDMHPLISHGVLFEMYEMKTLNTNESLQLFRQTAFKGCEPKEDYSKLSEKVVEYAGGLPLALEVLGSFLCGRSVPEWKAALTQIRKVPPNNMVKKLKISYDMLEDEHKTIFLDIACFFRGWYKDKVTKILDNCGLSSTIGINVLIEKSLVTCKEGVLRMHDLLEEMGKTIVLQESPNDASRCSRLWSPVDIDKVLRENRGTENVQGVVLKSQTEAYGAPWHPRVFSAMCNIRLFIILCDLHRLKSLKCLPSSLKVLIWMKYPLKALPRDVQLCELVHLQMSNSKVKKLWNGTLFFGKLKVIDLANSRHLTETPNISGVPKLEEFFLDDCYSLVKVHQSVGQHKKLAVLSLSGCYRLKILPRKLEMSSLKMLFLCQCLKVKKLPDFGENMECLSVLNLTGCKSLLCLPNTISNLKSLKHLNLSGCSKVCRLPDNINENKDLEDLDLSETSIREVSSSLFHLQNLKRLSFRHCSGPVPNSRKLLLPFALEFGRKPAPTNYLKLPASISGLSSLIFLDLSCCNLNYELIPTDLGCLSSLETLILSWNRGLELPVANIANLSRLRRLELEGCRSLEDQSLLPVPVEASLFIDLLGFWKLFEPNQSEILYQVRDRSCPVYCYKSHPRFANEIFFPGSPKFLRLPTASIIVDIPDGCRRGEWWGIVVFFAFDLPITLMIDLCWSFGASHPEASFSLFSESQEIFDYNGWLVTMIMTDNYIYIQLHYRKHHNTSASMPFWKYHKPDFSENSRLHFDVRGGRYQKIKKYGYRVLNKEDFRSEALIKSHNRIADKPNSGESSNLNNSAAMEFKGKDITASNGELQ